MTAAINPRHLEALKNLTLSVAGLKSITPMDCRLISFSIMKKTGIGVSETTIKRVYGFAMSKFSPSLYTLNAFAIYCEYPGWEAFRKAQPSEVPTDHDSISDIISNPLVSVLLETSIPALILKANVPDFTIITYNKAYRDVTYTQKRDVKGMVFWDAFDPGKAGGYGPTLLLEAFNQAVDTMRAVQMEPLHYNIPSALPHIGELSWWDVKITPVVYDGITQYLFVNVQNITGKILHQDAIEQALIKELTMAEDLATTNVQLNIAVEKLAESHQELSSAKDQLQKFNQHLEQRVFTRTKKLLENEAKQRKLIDNAPVAIAVLIGPDHVIETANKKIIDYWGKGDIVIGKPLAVALPELEGQPFIEILNEVHRSGVPYINPELVAFLNFEGLFQPRYYDMIYQPIQNAAGNTDSIYIVAVDITDHVMARKNLEQSESLLRLAVTAANIGIWSVAPKSKTITYNRMFAKILGWDSDEIMTYDQAIGQVTDEFREKIRTVAENSITDGADFDFTYTHKRFNDGKVIWLQSTGKITNDDSGENTVFSGILREVSNYVKNL